MKDSGGEPPFLRAIDQQAFETYQHKGRGAVALVTNEAGEILLHLRDNKPWIAHPNVWALLGGVCEEGEEPLDAVLREVFEEAELTVETAEPLCRLVDTEGSQNLITVFRMTTSALLVDLHLHEGQDLRFFPLRQIHKIPLVPWARHVLNEFSNPK